MAKQIKRRRGTTIEHTTVSGGFVGALGEITVDTDKKTLVVHDDLTIGGWPVLREDLTNVDISILNSLIEPGLIGAATVAQGALAETNEIQISIINTQLISLAAADSVLDLSDTPAVFGTVGQVLIVNLATDALEFADVATTFQGLTDANNYVVGDADKVVKVNSAGDGIEFGQVLPVFGTIVTEDITDFATDTQGDLADTALQLADLTGLIEESMLDTALADKVNDNSLDNLVGTTTPGATDDSDDGYSVGSFWIDIVASPNESYRAVDVTPNAAIWILTTLTTDDLGTSAILDTGLTSGKVVIVQGTGKIDPSILPANALQDITNESILDLDDTPSSYSGQANKLLAVNSGEDAVEFVVQPSSARIEDSSGDTFVDTELTADQVDIWASDGASSKPVAVFVSNAFATLGEKLTVSNDAAKTIIAATNISGSTPVDIILRPQLTGEVFVDGSGTQGIISATPDNSLTVTGGEAISAGAGDLVLRGGDGTGGFLSGNVDIQGGTGGAAAGNVLINGLKYPTVDGSNGDVLISDGAGNLTFSSLPAIVTTFQGLTDADNYTVPDAGKVVRVNAGGTGIDFGIVLGTAAASSTGDFATAAQGTLADSALQSISLLSITEGMLTNTVQTKLNDSILNNLNAVVNPNANDDSGDGYEVGSLWVNVSTDDAFINVNDSAGSAIWEQINVSISGLGTAAFEDVGFFATAVQGTKADNALPITGGTLLGTITLSNDPVIALDAATKQFVESFIFQMGNKFSACVATTAALSGTYTSGNEPTSNPWSALGTSLTIDGVILANDDRILVKDETTNNKGNGIFEVSGVGSAVVLNRVEDADNVDNTIDFEVSGGMYLFITEGTINQNTGWVMSTPDAEAVLGTDAIEFVQFSNRFTTADEAKLDTIENSATVDQTDGEIKTAYENNANTNAFTDANVTTLAGALQRAGGTMTGDLTLNADPTVDLHAATKQYVDNTAAGLDHKQSVRAATTGSITLSGTQTVDSVILVANDRVLVKNQGTGSQNGIYDVKAGAWVRSFDADNSPAGEVSGGMFTFVQEGGQVGTGWVMNSPSGVANLGVDTLTFVQFSDSTAPVSSVFGRTGAVISANGDYTASQLTNVPSGTIGSGTVQAALNELDNDKLAKSGDTMSGDLTLNSGVQILGDNASPAAAPTYSFTGDVNTGIRRSAVDTINFVTGGADRVGLSTTVLATTVPIDMNNNKITELANPTVSTDATNKNYVDGQINNLRVEEINGLIETPQNKTLIFVLQAKHAYTVNEITTFVSSGSFTLDVRRGGGTMLAGTINVTNSVTTTAMTTNNSVVVGNQLTLVISGVASPVDFSFTMKITRV